MLPLRESGSGPMQGEKCWLRSDRPLRYGVSSTERAVLLHLPDAAIPVANNRRPLDTRFFGAPCSEWVPTAASGRDRRADRAARAAEST